MMRRMRTRTGNLGSFGYAAPGVVSSSTGVNMTTDMIAMYKVMLRADPKHTTVRLGTRLTGTGTSYMFRINSNAGIVSLVLAPGRNKASAYEQYLK